MKHFLVILLGIIIFPIMLILGLITGIVQVYKAYAHAFLMTLGKEEELL